LFKIVSGKFSLKLVETKIIPCLQFVLCS